MLDAPPINRGQLDALIKELDVLGLDHDDDPITLDFPNAQGPFHYILAQPDDEPRPFYIHPDGTISR
jgi:hypothetical protein